MVKLGVRTAQLAARAVQEPDDGRLAQRAARAQAQPAERAGQVKEDVPARDDLAGRGDGLEADDAAVGAVIVGACHRRGRADGGSRGLLVVVLVGHVDACHHVMMIGRVAGGVNNGGPVSKRRPVVKEKTAEDKN